MQPVNRTNNCLDTRLCVASFHWVCHAIILTILNLNYNINDMCYILLMRLQGRLLVIITALLWGLAGVCVKSIPWGTMSIAAGRCIIAVILLGLYRKSFKVVFNKNTFFPALAMSLTGVLYMTAIKMTTAASAIVLQYIAPILVFLYAVIFQKQKTNIKQILIVLMVFVGCGLSFLGDLDFTKIMGNVLAILSGFAFAWQIIQFADEKTNSFDCSYLANLMTFIVCLPFALFDDKLVFTSQSIFWILILGVFQYGLANILYSKACKMVDKVECSLLLTFEPIFDPIPVALITGERMSTMGFIGFIIVITGIVLYTLSEKTTNK